MYNSKHCVRNCRYNDGISNVNSSYFYGHLIIVIYSSVYIYFLKFEFKYLVKQLRL